MSVGVGEECHPQVVVIRPVDVADRKRNLADVTEIDQESLQCAGGTN
jgi:hypothetical protein